MTLKVCFNNKVHEIARAPDTLNRLKQLIIFFFGTRLPKVWHLQYTDNDGDNIFLSNEDDYKEFKDLQQCGIATKVDIIYPIVLELSAIKPEDVVVVESEDEDNNNEDYEIIDKENIEDNKNNEFQDNSIREVHIGDYTDRVTHFNITCSGCQMSPIIGTRYKCQTCANMNYCERCKGQHSYHEYIEMKRPNLLEFFGDSSSNSVVRNCPTDFSEWKNYSPNVGVKTNNLFNKINLAELKGGKCKS